MDSDNSIVHEIADALQNHRSSTVSLYVTGINALDLKYSDLYSFIPENPIENFLFPHLSYMDNLTMKKNQSLSLAFGVTEKFYKSIKTEYGKIIGEKILLQNLMDCSPRNLYELIYQKILIEKPKVVFMYQPFDTLDMMQCIRIMEHICKIKNSGCPVVILASAPTEYFRIASHVVVIKDDKVFHTLDSDRISSFFIQKS